MKMCQIHWDQLRASIEANGLMGLVSKDGAVAVEKIKREFDNQGTAADNYDPLMAANFAIWSNAVHMGGLYLIEGDKNGNPYCPICEAVKNSPDDIPQHKAEWWINNAVCDQVVRAREMGLIPGIQ